MSTTRLFVLALLCAVLTGCSSSGGRWNLLASRDSREASAARKKLKNPRRLDLAYAKWQEQVGNLTDAREGYQRVLHDEPQSVEAQLGLARLDQLAGRMQEAEQGYRKAMKAAPSNPTVLDALGQFYAAQEKWPMAIDFSKQALALSPNDKTIRFHLAVAMAKSGDIQGAKPHFVSSVGDAEADYNLGLIQHDQGKLDLAEQYFVQASAKKPTLEQAQFWLSEIRVEKETKQLLTGNSSRPRPEMQAPAGALPTNTVMQPVAVQEQRLSPDEVRGIQQTAGQQPFGRNFNAPDRPNDSGVSHAIGYAPATRSSPGNTNINNPFGTGNPWQTLSPGAATPSNPAPGGNGLTPQQLEQLHNQR